MSSYDLQAFLKIIVPSAILIFVVIFLLILLTRLFFKLLLFFAKKNYKSFLENKNNKRKFFSKVDGELFRRKQENVKQNGLNQKEIKGHNLSRINQYQGQLQDGEVEETKIVGIVKPVGYWTSMILGQKLTYLISSAQLINQNSKRGFWVSMIEAQERAAGRERGRSL